MSTFNIKPYPRVAVYPTSWAGDLTFQQIYDNLAHYASNVMKRNGFRPHEIPECLQNGFMVLWEMLVAQRDFRKRKPAVRRCHRHQDKESARPKS